MKTIVLGAGDVSVYGSQTISTPNIDRNNTLPRGVLEAGFDTYFGTPFSHKEPPFVYVKDRQVVALDPADPIKIIPKHVERCRWGWEESRGADGAGDRVRKAKAELQLPAVFPGLKKTVVCPRFCSMLCGC
jgi:hypothetical protein